MTRGGDPDSDDRVLSPDELDIEAREEVAALGEDRYVIGADGSPDAPDPAADRSDDGGSGASDPGDEDPGDDADAADAGSDAADSGRGEAARAGSDSSDGAADVTGREVKQWLGEELAAHDSAYAYHIAAKSGGSVTHQQLATDDVSAAFDGLLLWYARQLADGTPVDEALGILLAESSVQVRYPTARLTAYLDAHDLGPEDSIADLVDVVADADGLVFPGQQ